MTPLTVLAVATAAADDGGLLPMLMFLLSLLLLAWLWFAARRRQRAAEAESAATLASLHPGRQVLTTSGLVGTLRSREDGFARLEVASGVVLTFDERALLGEAPENAPQTGGVLPVPTASPKEAD
ncbi:preprotein translocase subunit YajC [Arsenicicoccus dermatophilus]|uniref:preprotein translocase subunit YajC n=1 Tax=Arsenicicoccus dermatophilus TaxID=1076331 RepID=UPI001F4CCB20|nr:preprotein translocase subunit YajC [Arsenicicoccus dermatophilus]MCH8613032.1 preprotein translocase subunit YajC [Arsenicicoccus dermatophilus]